MEFSMDTLNKRINETRENMFSLESLNKRIKEVNKTDMVHDVAMMFGFNYPLSNNTLREIDEYITNLQYLGIIDDNYRRTESF